MTNLSTLPISKAIVLDAPHWYGPRLRRHVLANHCAAALLVEVAPELAALTEGACLTPDMRQELLRGIARQRDDDFRTAVHRAVDRVVLYGNAAQLWSIPSLGYVAQHALEATPFTVGDAATIASSLQWTRSLDAALPEILASNDGLVVRGAFALSLGLHDALLIPAFLEHAVAGELGATDEGQTAWLKFTYLPSPKSKDGPRCRRWIAGERSAALLARCTKMGAATDGETGFAAAMGALAAILKQDLPRTAAALVRALYPAWSVRLPPALMRLVTVAGSTESLTDDTVLRLSRGVRLAKSRSPESQRKRLRYDAMHARRIRVAAMAPPTRDLTLQLAALSKLRALLYHRPRTPQPDKPELVRRFDDWHRDHGAVGGWVLLMAQWSEAAMHEPRVRGNARNLALGTVRRYMVAVGKWLLLLAGDLVPGEATESELMARLDTLRLAVANLASAGVVHVALADLLGFWEENGGLRIELADWWGAPPRGGRPDANLLTPLEYSRLLDWIDQCYASKPGCHGHRRARAIAMVAFRTGARWGELRTLGVACVRVLGRPGQEEVSMIVTDNLFADVKSSFSERILRLDQFLPAAEFDEVVAFLTDAIRGTFWGASNPGALVFAEPESPERPCRNEETRDLVQAGMRAVSGDLSLVFHHLRHAAATWLELRMMAPSLPGFAAVWGGVDLIGCSAFDFAREGWSSYGDWLAGRPDDAHVFPYILSGVLGQLDAEVSYAHYVHLSELSVFVATQSEALPLMGRALVAVRGWKSAGTGYQAATRAKQKARIVASEV